VKNKLYREKVEFSRLQERSRINFLIDRDSLDSCVLFVKRTLTQYKKCLAWRNPSKIGSKYHYSRNSEYRHQFIGSVLEFKLFLKEVKNVSL
jgi:hypothetical protein